MRGRESGSRGVVASVIPPYKVRVCVSCAESSLIPATLVVFSFGFFAKAMGQEFHVGRGKISLAFAIHNLTAALFVPLAGRLVDR